MEEYLISPEDTWVRLTQDSAGGQPLHDFQ